MAAKPKRSSTSVTVVSQDEKSVEGFISQAVAMNAPVETMERLFALRVQVKAEKAKEEFVKELSGFQTDCPVIQKTKKVLNRDGTLRYTYAPLDSIVEQIKVPLKEHNLSYRWETNTEGKSITATCIVTHILGHSESSSFTVDADESGYMTSPQKSASSLTFAKRYSLIGALGIATADEDTDATDAAKEKDADSVKSRIILRLRALGQKTGTKKEVADAVLALTKLELMEENYEEIAQRLKVLIDENEGN